MTSQYSTDTEPRKWCVRRLTIESEYSLKMESSQSIEIYLLSLETRGGIKWLSCITCYQRQLSKPDHQSFGVTKRNWDSAGIRLLYFFLLNVAHPAIIFNSLSTVEKLLGPYTCSERLFDIDQITFNHVSFETYK